jgi:chaperonin GroES
MPEMPIDPEFGRFIEGITMTPEGGAMVELPDEMSEIEELPDGSAVVNLEGFKGPQENEDFYQNLADEFDPVELSQIAMRYINLIEKDKRAREERDKQYEEGLKRTGLGNDAPGGAQFQGASRVVHPVMAEACVDFAARAIKEMFPPDGPARTKILGDVTDEKTEVAERKRDYINWQLTEQIEEFRDEQEQLLTQLPLGGSQYLKLWYDEEKRRPCAEFIPIDNMLLPFAAANFYTAQRATEVQDITEWEYQRRIDRGLYRDIDFIRATMEPEQSAAEKANNKIEGRKFQENEDGTRRVFHIYTYLSIEEDTYSKGENAPYVLMIDELEHEVIGLYRNWEEGDETMSKLDWIIEFKFIPWRGAYAIGLPHLIGGLSAALTGALRALMDSAHINNAATMLKLKGAKISGQSQQVEVTQVAEIEGAPGVDDIRKIAMPMPFNPPSPVLMELLGWLTNAAKGVVTTAEEKIGDATSNMPVGTTQALIEQGAAVFSSIHARLHASQRKVFMVLQRINRWYLEDQRKGDIVAELPISREDFKRNSDVVPVSDPNIFSETQRMAQMQAVLQMAGSYPQLFDLRAVMGRMLKQLKIPNVNELLPNSAKPAELNAADENAAMALGKAAFAYPYQDHLAHIQAHLNFAMDPNLGSSKLIAPRFVPQVLEHIKQHMMLWYSSQMTGYVEAAAGAKLGKYEDSKVAASIDKAIAVASDHVKMDSGEVFGQVQPILEQLAQLLQSFPQPSPPPDAEAQAVLQASLAETQRRAAADQADQQIKMAKLQADMAEKEKDRQVKVAMNAENNLTTERMKTADLVADEAKLRQEQEETAIRLNQEVQRKLGG